MIAAIIIISPAFAYLLYETDFMRIRLLVGCEKKPKISPAFEIMLCRNCNFGSRLHSWRTCGKDKERVFGYEIPARTVNAYGCTMNFNKGCNILRAKTLRDIQLAQTSHRAIKGSSVRTMPAMYHADGARPQIDFGKWRPNTKYSEPEIEILVNGESKGKFNGNYKRGMIKQAMKAKG